MDELSILIVDDDTDVSGFIRTRLLADAGHFVIATVDGAEACITHLKSNRVDCILSDYQMPGMDGMQLLKAIRGSGDDTPFIFITGQGNEEVAREAFKAGANDYFTKDIGFAHFTRIINSVEQAVRQRRAERLKVESDEALLEERNKLQAIISSIGDGLSIQDTEYRIIYQNALIEKMGGKHVGECCYSAYEEKDAVCEDCPLRKSFEDGGTHRAERCVIKFGRPLAVDITTSPIRDASGQIIGGIELVRNITERKAREQELEESESRFRGLVEGSSIGAVIIQDGVFVYVNPRFAEMLGYTVETLTGREPQSIIHPDDRHIVLENIRRRLSGDIDSIRYTTRMVHKTARVLYVEVHGSRSAYRGRPAIVGSVIDLTERRHAQDSLAHSLRLLDTISKAKYYLQAGETPKPLFDELLKSIVELTESGVGFIGEVYEDNGGRPYLKTYSLIAPGCEIAGHGGISGVNGHYLEFSNLETLFGRVISTGRFVISNDLAGDTKGKVLPEGHIPLTSFMGTPFISPYTGELLGMVGIGNRPGGYDENMVPLLNPLITTCANIIDVYRNERKHKAAEEALGMSQERLLKAQSIAKLGYWDWNMRENTLHWSDEIYRMFGTTPDEFGASYEAFIGFVHPEDRTTVEERVNRSIERREPYAVDHRIVLPDGEVRFVAESGEVTYDVSGAATRMMGTVLDITDRKRAEVELRERARHAALGADVGSSLTKGATIEEMLQGCAEAMVEHLDAAFARIWVAEGVGVLRLKASAGMYTHLDGPHGTVKIGPAGYKIGLIAERIAPHLSNDLQNDREISDRAWALREGLVSFAGHPLVLDGRLVGVMAMFARKPLSDATIDMLASVAQNIALGIERKRANYALRESEEKFRSLVEESLVGAYVYQDGRLVYANPRLAEMYGYSLDELMAMDLLVELVHPDDRDKIKESMSACMDGRNKSSMCSCRVLRKGGGLLYVDVMGWATNYWGKPAVIGTVLDVTDRKKAEAERASFYHMLTHDIKGPLSIIQGYEELLRENVDEDGRDILNEIRKAAGRILALLMDMLDISRIESGKYRMELQPVSLRELVDSTVRDHELLAGQMGVSLVVEFPDGLPRPEADPVQLGRALGNLVGNAVAYNRRGGQVTVSAHMGAGQEEVVIEVADTGPGIAMEDLPHIFEKYYRCRNTSRIKGTGLGLAIVRAILEAHGGWVEVESEVGSGSTFRMHLPLRRPSDS